MTKARFLSLLLIASLLACMFAWFHGFVPSGFHGIVPSGMSDGGGLR